MRKASLGTIFLTVFLDLLGFGLVVPFLPGVARDLGASSFLATLLAAVYSLMQFLFVPLWGRLSDRVGRRPVLLISIAVSVVGMTLLGFADSLWLLLLARVWSGIGTANIAVAQAYIADVTTPENRARGMGMIGMAFGLGFIFGPAMGGFLGGLSGRPGALAAFCAAGLSLLNLVLCWRFVPESRVAGVEPRTAARRSALDLRALGDALKTPGLGLAVILMFVVVFFFSGMETTFRLFNEDAFGMTIAGTGAVFTMVGVIAALVQGGLISKLTRRFGEVALIRAGIVVLGTGFLGLALAPSVANGAVVALYAASALIALGSGLNNPSLSSYASRQADEATQGLSLGVMQSMSALARAVGPVAGGALYQYVGFRAPYAFGSAGLFLGAALSLRLLPLQRAIATADR